MITQFRDVHPGADVYVLAAGNTLSYLDQGFFDGKITVAVNEVASRWPITPTYIVGKHHPFMVHEAEAMAPVPVIVPRHDVASFGSPLWETAHANVHTFDHLNNLVHEFIATRDWPEYPDQLVVSWSTITTAMHFAAYLGAANIILVAHDCGQLGDVPYLPGYQAANHSTDQLGLEWVLQIEDQSRQVKRELVKRYGVRVYSLSPFLNYNLEGVPYVGQSNRINAS